MRYICDPHILPTNTCPPDLSELARITEELSRFSLEIQLDLADGAFAPVTSWPYRHPQWSELEALSISKGLPMSDRIFYEAHLMVQDPLDIGIRLARAGVKRIVPHVEALAGKPEAMSYFSQWHDAGAQEVGLALLIDTPLEAVDPYINECDVVQLMSIASIGAQGQPFDDRALSRVEELHARYPEKIVSVDGGITEATVEALVRAGANRLCVGSAISKAADPAAAFARMHERAMLGCAPEDAVLSS